MILTRFLERWPILADRGRLHNRDLPRLLSRLGPLRWHLLLRLEAQKAAHLPQLYESLSNLCSCEPLQFQNLLLFSFPLEYTEELSNLLVLRIVAGGKRDPAKK